MKKRLLVCLLMFFGLFICAGNNSLYSSDSIENESPFIDQAIPEWDEKYKNEHVVWLLDEHILEFNSDFSYTEETHIVIKIQSEQGKEAGNITVSYDNETDVIEYIQAYTITPEGKRIKCTQVTDRNAYEAYGVLSENRVKLLTMPQVVAGSLLEVKHRIIHKKPVIENNIFLSFPIASVAPVKVRRIKLVTPENMELRFKNQNTDMKPKVDPADNKEIYLWEIKGKEAVLQESNMPSIAEVCQMVSVSSLKSWTQLADLFWDLFNKNVIVSQDIKTKIKEITAKDKSAREKIQSIIEYIKGECRYVSMSIDSHHYEPHPSDEVFMNKYGDCKDQTILALAMLKEIGIKAYPALFSYTFDPDFEKRLPMPLYFNHVILCIEYEGARYYTDVMRKGFYFDETSYALSGAYVLVLNGKGGFLDRIPASNPATYIRSSEFEIEINEDGSAIFDGFISFPRIVSTRMRNTYLNNTSEEREKWLSSLDASLSGGGTMLNREFNNLDDPYENIKLKIIYKRTDFVQVANDMMIFGLGRMDTPKLPSIERIHPIIFTDSKSENKSHFKIPEDFEILNLPEDIHYKTEFASFDRTYKQDGRSIIVINVFEIKMARLPADSYEEVRDFFSNVRSSTNDKIIIKRKGV